MIAVDTNVLLRYLLSDDKIQSHKAKILFADGRKVLIVDAVLVETLWTLKGKRYNLDNEAQFLVLSALFNDLNIVFEDKPTLWRAINMFGSNSPIKVGSKKKTADFADALIVEKAKTVCKNKGYAFNGVYTFDVAAQQLNGAMVP